MSDADAFADGLRRGFEHGYAIGHAHAERELPDPVDLGPADTARGPRDRPDRDELAARGYIPRDPSRPPSLPVRMWNAEDWAKADARDLPTTDHGRAQWSAAIAAGTVPPDLAEAYRAHAGGARPSRADGEVAQALAGTDRHLEAARAHLAERDADQRRRTLMDRWRLEDATREHTADVADGAHLDGWAPR